MKKISDASTTKKILLGLPSILIKQVDALAGRMGLARAELLRRSLEDLLEKDRLEEEARAKARRRDEAIRQMESLREVFGSDRRWNPTEIVREWRDQDRLARKGRAA